MMCVCVKGLSICVCVCVLKYVFQNGQSNPKFRPAALAKKLLPTHSYSHRFLWTKFYDEKVAATMDVETRLCKELFAEILQLQS